MYKPRPGAALFAVLCATALLCGGCKDFFHPEGPTKTPGPYPLTDEQAADAFREIETVKEALKINVVEIGLDAPAEDLAALETKVDEALAAYDELSQGARSALSAEKAKLDAVKEKIGHVNSALGFQKEHEATLAKSPEELETPEEAADLLPVLDEALKAIEALPEGAQELLEDDIALLEDLKAKAEELTAPPTQYTITFDSHGGSAVEAITEDEGTEVPKPADSTLDGYTFLGWFTAASGGTKYDWPHTLTESITVHAQWQDDVLPPPPQYTITFDSHEGTELEAITANEGTPVNEPGEPARDGYRFLGWFPMADGGTKYDWPYTISADITFHARWVRQYTIAFESHDGSPVLPVTADEGAEVPRPDDPARSGGYRFLGWFDAASGGVEHTAWPHTLAGDITLHARWVRQYTIAFNTHGGSPVPSATADEGAGVPKPADPTRTGYGFDGWFPTAGGGAKYAWPHTLTGDVTMHAQWTAIDYPIVYHLYEGANDPKNPLTYTIESPAITLLDPTHTAREFQDWYTDPGFDQADLVTEIPADSTGPKTFYARWRPLAPIETTLLQPAADPALVEQVVFEGSTAAFTAAGDHADHQWYWDGELESGQTGPTYTLTGEEAAGIHELSVVVSGGGGKPLSARCKVTIKAN